MRLAVTGAIWLTVYFNEIKNTYVNPGYKLILIPSHLSPLRRFTVYK